VKSFLKIPRVSIGLPVYNGEKYLVKTLDNLLGQSFSDIEIVISDDGSLDKTEDICNQYLYKDPRIRYYRQSSNFRMPVKNFRFALDKAHGEYFMFACHDDSWDRNYIKELVNILDSNPECSLAFSNYKIKNLMGDDEIAVDVSSSVSGSKYIRYMTRIIDTQPALIFGLFRRKTFSSKNLILADFFTLHFGNLMALQGKIKIFEGYMMSWGIDGLRKSYSLSGKIISYRKYFITQLKLIIKNFNFLHWFLPIIFLLAWMINGWIKRRLFPEKFSINFFHKHDKKIIHNHDQKN
jgi:glycosyltransferase involved in cell wall biosynthesis